VISTIGELEVESAVRVPKRYPIKTVVVAEAAKLVHGQALRVHAYCHKKIGDRTCDAKVCVHGDRAGFANFAPQNSLWSWSTPLCRTSRSALLRAGASFTRRPQIAIRLAHAQTRAPRNDNRTAIRRKTNARCAALQGSVAHMCLFRIMHHRT
jgi:hypothetical protein